MTKRHQITLGGLVAMAAVLAGCASYPTQGPKGVDKRKPNIILIVADDLGVNDVGYNGNSTVRTPHIDALAKKGAEFTTAYASSPVCSTSRAGLLTGQYQQRFGMESNPSPRLLAQQTVEDDPGAEIVPALPDDPDHAARGLPPEAETLAERLSAIGYRTAHIGKWHLGSAPGYTPLDQGFDNFYGFLGGASLFAELDNKDVVRAALPWSGLDNFLWNRLPYSLEHNGEPQSERGYQTDVFADAAAQYVKSSDEAPFFLSIAFNAPHTPLQAPRELVDNQPEYLPARKRVYYAMIESLDVGIGKILKALEESGANERTIIILTSDNGGAGYIRIADVNAPYRGFKANFWEGGIRVPLLVFNPFDKGGSAKIDRPVSLLDIAPMIFDAANVSIEGLDGQSLFGSPAQDASRALVWRNNTVSAIRDGDWKLIIDAHRQKSWLYNISDDPLEQNNLITTEAERAAELEAKFLDITADWPSSPAWGPTYLIPVHADPQPPEPGNQPNDWTMWPG